MLNILDNKKVFTDKKFIVAVAALCCFLWGSAYPAIKIGYKLFNIASKDVPSELVFAGYRFTIAGIMVLVIAQVSGQKIFALSKKNIVNLFILGITQTALQYLFFYIGLANTTGVKSSIMYSTSTFFSVILANFLYKNDKIHKQKIIGCIIGFVGVMIVNLSADLLNFSFTFLGEGFVMISAFVFSAASIYGKKLTRNKDVILVTGYNLFIGGIVLTFVGLVMGGKVYNFTIKSSILLTYMALLSAVSFSLWTLLLKYNKVGEISVFNFLIPVFGTTLSSIFLGENIFEYKNMAAILLVCVGIWLANKEKNMHSKELPEIK